MHPIFGFFPFRVDDIIFFNRDGLNDYLSGFDDQTVVLETRNLAMSRKVRDVLVRVLLNSDQIINFRHLDPDVQKERIQESIDFLHTTISHLRLHVVARKVDTIVEGIHTTKVEILVYVENILTKVTLQHFVTDKYGAEVLECYLSIIATNTAMQIKDFLFNELELNIHPPEIFCSIRIFSAREIELLSFISQAVGLVSEDMIGTYKRALGDPTPEDRLVSVFPLNDCPHNLDNIDRLENSDQALPDEDAIVLDGELTAEKAVLINVLISKIAISSLFE